jgi:hypothetical protein
MNDAAASSDALSASDAAPAGDAAEAGDAVAQNDAMPAPDASPGDALSPDASGNPAVGDVRFVWHTSPATDMYTNNPSPTQQQWLRDHMWGMQVYSTYFDSRLSWFPNGLVYADSYAIYNPTFFPGNTVSTDHPEFILRDGQGNALYIPFDCNKNGTGQCTQFAADIGSPAYRGYFIAAVQALIQIGYRGVWIDDVNLDFRVGDGNGQHVDPIDPRTGMTMTGADWARYFAEFMEALRAALPGVRILHNSIWYAGNGGPPWTDPSVEREIRAANIINLERGVLDGGLTGGTGFFSLTSLRAFVDHVHALGASVVYDSESNGFDANDPVRREYNLAHCFLTATASDAVGNDAANPDNWWAGYDVHLGAALGPRTTWNNLERRDFERGLVLLNEPGAQTTTATLPMALHRVDGSTVSSIALSASQGAVLLR